METLLPSEDGGRHWSDMAVSQSQGLTATTRSEEEAGKDFRLESEGTQPCQHPPLWLPPFGTTRQIPVVLTHPGSDLYLFFFCLPISPCQSFWTLLSLWEAHKFSKTFPWTWEEWATLSDYHCPHFCVPHAKTVSGIPWVFRYFNYFKKYQHPSVCPGSIPGRQYLHLLGKNLLMKYL